MTKARIPKVLLLSHDCDLVLYQTFKALNDNGKAEITIAAPDEAVLPVDSMKRVAMPAIKSKFTLKAICKLRHVIKALRPDIIFAVSTSALSTAIQATRCMRHAPAIVGYRGTQARVHPFDPTYRMALLNKRVAHIVCETPDICQYLSGYIPAEKLSGRPKPFMRQWVQNAMAHPVAIGKEGDQIKIIYIGITKGRPHKGLPILLKAAEILADEGLKISLTVVGDAEPHDIQSARQDIVTFTGNRPDAMHYLPGADVFALPSLRDASPRVIREAQACGVPCVVSDIPGARDLITTGNDPSGILVPPGDAQAMAQAIKDIALDPEVRARMSAAALRNIDDNYAMADYVEYFDKLFRKIAGQSGR